MRLFKEPLIGRYIVYCSCLRLMASWLVRPWQRGPANRLLHSGRADAAAVFGVDPFAHRGRVGSLAAALKSAL